LALLLLSFDALQEETCGFVIRVSRYEPSGEGLLEDGLAQATGLLEALLDGGLQLVHHREAAFNFADDEELFLARKYGYSIRSYIH
jgi:hypothetical protein